MYQYNIHAAKTQLSSLVEQAAAGESFIIAKAGKPMVVVLPYEEPDKPPRVGFLKDEINIPDDFDTMDATEIVGLFEDDL